MNQEQQMVHQFHERFGLLMNTRPSLPGVAVHRLRTLLIEEELAEFRNAGEGVVAPQPTAATRRPDANWLSTTPRTSGGW